MKASTPTTAYIRENLKQFEDSANVTERIEQIRKGRKISTWERQLGIGANCLSMVLKKGRTLSQANIIRLCIAENISADWLLLGIGRMYREEQGTKKPGCANSQASSEITESTFSTQ